MPTPFGHTLRALEADDFRSIRMALVGVAVFGAAWTLWLTLARIKVWEVSQDARLEAVAEARPIQSLVGGRVVAVLARVGEPVEEGDVLLELDTTRAELALAEADARYSALAARNPSVQAELEAAIQAASEAERAHQAALAQADWEVEEARAAALLARTEAERMDRLQAEGHVSTWEAQQAKAAAEVAAAVQAAREAAREARGWEGRSTASDWRARIESLRDEVALLDGGLQEAEAAGARLGQEVELHEVRAPATGILAELGAYRPGSVLSPGEVLGQVLPDGEVHVVASFLPSDALGRIRPGQPARIRLEAWPWTRYGTLGARVDRVAQEVRDGRIRAELAIEERPAGIVVEHGLVGQAEVQVEEASPATLILRAAGGLQVPVPQVHEGP